MAIADPPVLFPPITRSWPEFSGVAVKQQRGVDIALTYCHVSDEADCACAVEALGALGGVPGKTALTHQTIATQRSSITRAWRCGLRTVLYCRTAVSYSIDQLKLMADGAFWAARTRWCT